MAQQYLLPCECGRSSTVTAAQAGQLLTCACGREQKVPTFGVVRELAKPEPTITTRTGVDRKRSPLVAWLVAIVTVSLAAFVGTWWWSTRVPTPELPEINVRNNDPDVVEAVASAKAAVQQSPRSPEAWGRLAMVLHGNALEKSADDCYAAAAQLDPNNPDWPYLRGFMHQDGAGGPEVAIPLYERAAALSPPNSVARLRLGDMLLAQGRLDDAGREYDRVLAVSSQEPDAKLGKAAIGVARQQYSEAQAILEPLAEHPQVQKRASELLATVYQRQGNAAAAGQLRQRLATLPTDAARPDDPMNRVGELQVGLSARLRKAKVLSEQRRFVDAVNSLKEAVARYPSADEAWSNLAGALRQIGDAGGAEQAMRRCLELAPQSADYRMNLGMLLLEQQRFDEAAESFRASIHLRPTLGMAQFFLGECLFHSGDKADAKEAFEKALRLVPDYEPAKRRIEEIAHQQESAESAPPMP
jgi:Tfp pilus assembly protein PilF